MHVRRSSFTNHSTSLIASALIRITTEFCKVNCWIMLHVQRIFDLKRLNFAKAFLWLSFNLPYFACDNFMQS